MPNFVVTGAKCQKFAPSNCNTVQVVQAGYASHMLLVINHR